MYLGLRVEDKLDGKNNYSAWKDIIQSIFEEAEVWFLMVNTTQNPVVVPAEPVQLVEFNNNNAKADNGNYIYDSVDNNANHGDDLYIDHVSRV